MADSATDLGSTFGLGARTKQDRTLRLVGGIYAPVSDTVPHPMADLADRLYYGDNLDVLRGFPDACVDLVYLDPPFNSKKAYNAFYLSDSGTRSKAQLHAFADTWTWNPVVEDHLAYLSNTALHRGRVPDRLTRLIDSFVFALGKTPLAAYLVEMSVRLVEMRRVMTPKASLWLHCDPTAAHYLKVILDCLFGPERFLSEVVWRRTGAHSSARRPGPVHDLLLYYSKSADYTWNPQYTAYDPEYVRSHYTQVDSDGRRWMADNLTAVGTRNGSSGLPWHDFDVAAKGNHWKFSRENLDRLDAEGRIYWPLKGGWPRYKRYIDEVPGVPLQDVWSDIKPINARARERIGWATQKPVDLLARIIAISSNEGDVLLDPFCGCGTALEAAESLGRRWIGIDVTYLSVAVMQSRLYQRFGIRAPIEGSPTEVEGARKLAVQEPNGRDQFELWALTMVGAVPDGGVQKKGADGGVDGAITFGGSAGKIETVVVSVKSGHVQANLIQQLKGAMDARGAAMGLFVTLDEPTGPMRHEAAIAGIYRFGNRSYPRVQILSVRDLLEEGKRPDLPPTAVAASQGALWSSEVVPRVTRPPRRSPARRAPLFPPRDQPDIQESDQLREGYALREAEPSPEEPRSLRTSKRDRTAPLPSPESGDTG